MFTYYLLGLCVYIHRFDFLMRGFLIFVHEIPRAIEITAINIVIIFLGNTSCLWATPKNETQTSSLGRFARSQRPTGNVLNREMIPREMLSPLEASPGNVTRWRTIWVTTPEILLF